MKEIVIVSGGGNGLGEALVSRLIKNNYFVCNIDRDEDGLKRINTNFSSSGNYMSFLGNVEDEKFINETIIKISKLGNIIALFNNAGEPAFKLPIKYVKSDIDKCFKGLYGMILLSSRVLEVTNEKDVKIVNIMSSAALKGNKQESVYCATKWGERGYTESLKVMYKGTSVKIIGVYPGGINTSFYKNSRDYVTEKKQSRFMKSEEVAKIIVDNVFNNMNLTVSDLIIERNS